MYLLTISCNKLIFREMKLNETLSSNSQMVYKIRQNKFYILNEFSLSFCKNATFLFIWPEIDLSPGRCSSCKTRTEQKSWNRKFLRMVCSFLPLWLLVSLFSSSTSKSSYTSPLSMIFSLSFKQSIESCKNFSAFSDSPFSL